jgi:hypothetical protein
METLQARILPAGQGVVQIVPAFVPGTTGRTAPAVTVLVIDFTRCVEICATLMLYKLWPVCYPGFNSLLPGHEYLRK